MWLILNSLEFIPGNRLDFSYKPMLAASQHEPDRLLSTEEAEPEFPAPHAEPESGVVTTPLAAFLRAWILPL
jgi:hypothetical protein